MLSTILRCFLFPLFLASLLPDTALGNAICTFDGEAASKCAFNRTCVNTTVVGLGPPGGPPRGPPGGPSTGPPPIPLLASRCHMPGGDLSPTNATLNLDDHVANVDGHLFCTPLRGGFSGTCVGMAIINGSCLRATCLDSIGQNRVSYLNLNECVSNSDGALDWCGLDEDY